MNKKNDVDTMVNCPECKAKLKQQNLIYHMKHVHNIIIDETITKPLETSHNKRKENKTKKVISKTTITIITIIFIIVVASISVYFLSNSKDSNNQNYSKDQNGNIQNNSINSTDQNITNNHFVSIKGKGNYSSIQEAIDSASDNDTIFVSNDTYFEHITITKPIELIGEDKNTTIINGKGSYTVIQIEADYVNISGFTITNGGPIFNNNDAGIRIKSNYNTISNCIISSNRNFGLYLSGYFITPYNIIKNNIFSNNIYGIYADGSKTNNISSNIFTSNTEYGIYLLGQSDDNTISDNIFTDNNYAIRIKSSIFNKVIKNQIMNNIYGLFFCCGAKNNIVYYNIFINNTNWNAKDDPGNKWDDGKVGNYWDDYNGTDTDGDGIGDTPYIISTSKEDRFPLMKPILIMNL